MHTSLSVTDPTADADGEVAGKAGERISLEIKHARGEQEINQA